jgi:hypothetical protein
MKIFSAYASLVGIDSKVQRILPGVPKVVKMPLCVTHWS